MTSPIFIVGCGHSGTSILLRLLGAHSRLYAVPGESELFLGPDDAVAARAAAWDDACRAAGRARWVEKTPRHIHHLERLFRHFPDARVLLLLRDGRDVACSVRARLGSLLPGIDRWRRDNAAGRPFWTHPGVHVVRYEALVAAPDDVLRAVLAFVGEPYEHLLAYHRQPVAWYADAVDAPPPSADHDAYRNWQINQPLFDGSGRWRRELSAEEQRRLKRLAGPDLAAYGYDDAW